jgi:hypothetical protein
MGAEREPAWPKHFVCFVHRRVEFRESSFDSRKIPSLRALAFLGLMGSVGVEWVDVHDFRFDFQVFSIQASVDGHFQSIISSQALPGGLPRSKQVTRPDT